MILIIFIYIYIYIYITCLSYLLLFLYLYTLYNSISLTVFAGLLKICGNFPIVRYIKSYVTNSKYILYSIYFIPHINRIAYKMKHFIFAVWLCQYRLLHNEVQCTAHVNYWLHYTRHWVMQASLGVVCSKYTHAVDDTFWCHNTLLSLCTYGLNKRKMWWKSATQGNRYMYVSMNIAPTQY